MNLQGYFCVAFLDLLGTSAIDESISEAKISDPERAARMLAREVGKVQAFRTGFFNILDTLQQEGSTQSEVASEEAATREALLRGNPINYYTFSDSSIIHCSLNTQQGREVPVESCFKMLLAIALAQLQELSRGIPFRGGIEVDFAANHSDDGREILGPALSGAVKLEKCEAGFPRVAIGRGFTRYLSDHAAQDDSSSENQLNKKWAKNCSALICEDNKGVLAVDVTAPSLARWIGADLQRKLLDKSERFAREQISAHKTDTKLSEKYEALVSYLIKDRA
jgi:hypothetical protein